MKRLLSWLIFSIFLNTTLVAAPTNADLSRLKALASRILAIDASEYNSKEEFYDKYREVLYDQVPFVAKVLKDPSFIGEVDKTRFLGMLISSKDSKTLNILFDLLDWTTLTSKMSLFNVNNLNPVILSWYPALEQEVRIPDAVVAKLDDSINESMKLFKFSNSPAIQILLDPKSGIDLSMMPPLLSSFFKVVQEKYFDALGAPAKRRILSDVMILDEDAPADEVLATILNHCGPVIQKAFQLFSKDAKSPELSKILSRLRQNIKGFPTKLAKDIIRQETGIFVDDEFVSFPDKPLAAATMGQVYLVSNRLNERVIIKVQRPGILEKADAEFELLRGLTNDVSILNFLKEIQEAFNEESDFLIELENLRAGQIYELGGHDKIKVIHEVSGYVSTKKVLFLSLAEGKSIDTYGPQYNKRKLKALKRLLRHWVHEAIFGERLFHADLHPGNLFFNAPGKKSKHDSVTLLDFGSIGRFSLEEAKALFKIMIGLATSSEFLIMDGLKTVAKWKAETKEETVKAFVSEVVTSHKDTLERTKKFFDRGVEHGILLPKSFIQFYRGQAFLEKQITEIYQQKYGEELGLKKAERSLASLYSGVLRTDVLRDIKHTLCHSAGQCDRFVDGKVVQGLMEHLFGIDKATRILKLFKKKVKPSADDSEGYAQAS